MKTRNPKSGNHKPFAPGQPTADAGCHAWARGAVRWAAGGRIPGGGWRRAAFSLIEILVVVALMSVIILGLTAMFSQVQKTFRAGLTQTDVLAAGRLASDMLSRELEQITPAYQIRTDLDSPGFSPNFYAQIPYDANIYASMFAQPLPGNTIQRTNLIHDLFFLSKQNQYWVAIGYFVRVNDAQTGALSLSPLGIGNLYRFETNVHVLSTSRTVTNLFKEFSLARFNESRAAKVAEGVVNFKVRTFNTNGAWIVTNLNLNILGTNTPTRYPADKVGGEVELYAFQSNAVPGSVELELGILEDKTWQKFKTLPSFGPRPTAQERYLLNQVGRVHLFRQRVDVRNLDSAAYQ